MRRWTKAEEAELKAYLKSKKYSYVEISKLMNRSLNAVKIKATRKICGLGRHSKHKHLRLRAMTYFQSHTFEETQKKFGLTASELKSLMTLAYQDPSLAHLRKDDRKKDAWTFEQTMSLLQYAGLQRREWIARKLKRGTKEAVKEMGVRLKAKLRYINGVPKKWAEELLGHEVEGLKVKAGPNGRGFDGRPIIVPWVMIYAEAKKTQHVPDHIKDALKVMARFQRRIHRTRGLNDTMAQIKDIIGRK